MTNLADVEQISHHQKCGNYCKTRTATRHRTIAIYASYHRYRDLFDAYTVLAIAFALPQLITEWHLTPAYVGAIIAAGYVGQLVGAIFFGSLAEKVGRLKVLSLPFYCLWQWTFLVCLLGAECRC